MSAAGLLFMVGVLGALVALPMLSASLAARSRTPWLIHLVVLGPPVLLLLAATVGLGVVRTLLRTDGMALGAAATLALLALVLLPSIVVFGGRTVGEARRAVRWRPWPVVVLLLGCVAIAAAGIAWRDAGIRSELAQRLAASAARRERLLDPPAADQNAAELYRQAFDALPRELDAEIDDYRARTVPGEPPLTEEERLDMARIRAAIAPALALAEQAGARPRCDFGHDPRDFDDFTLMPELGQMRRLARAVAFAARTAAAEGDAAEAEAMVRTLHAMGGHLRETPTLIGALVGMAIDALALDTLVRASACVEIPPEAMTAPARWTRREAMTRAFLMERSVVEEMICGFATDGTMPASVTTDPTPRTIPRTVRVAYRGTILSTELETMDAVFDALESELARTGAAGLAAATLSPRPPGFLSAMLLPALDGAMTALEMSEAQEALVPLIAAAQRYRSANGHWPSGADDLVPALLDAAPSDPFDAGGAALRLAIDGDDLLVYSVGSNGTDEGGDIDQSGRKDVGVRLRPCEVGTATASP